MDKWVSICTIISGLCALVAIVISLFHFKHTVEHERKLDTIKVFSEIRRNFFNTKMLNNKDKLIYLNELEYFATGVNERIYDIDIVQKMSGRRLIRQYDDWAKELIEERRQKNSGRTPYSEYEKMILELRNRLKS